MPLSPEDFLQDLERRAAHFTTPCGAGHLAWRRWGRGEPLLLLHGGSGSWKHWVRNIDALAAKREVFACDLPGMGESAMPPMPASFPDYAGIVARGMEQLAPGRQYDIAGFSFGSITAQHIAHAFPARVRKIALINGHMIGHFTAQPGLILTRWRDITDPAEFEAVIRGNLRALMLSSDAVIDDLAVLLYGMDLRASRLRPGSMLEGRDPGMIAKLATPFVFIAGGLDPVGQPSVAAQAAAVKAARPEARVHILENTGHWAMYEAPARVNELLLAELR